jgi:hypothetical protein
MTLRAIVADLEDIPEALRGEYQEVPDPTNKEKTVFALDLDDSLKTHPKLRSLFTANDRLKIEVREKAQALAEANERLSKLPEDFDPDSYHAMVEEHSARGKKIDERIAAVRAEEAKKLETALAPLHQRTAQLEAAMKQKAAREALAGALASANIAPEYMAAANALISSKYKIKTEESSPGEFSVVIETDEGESDPKAFVREWANGEEGKPFVNKARGGGAEGGGGGPIRGAADNPFHKSGWNLTRQQKLIQSNPNQARALAQAAGVKPNW